MKTVVPVVGVGCLAVLVWSSPAADGEEVVRVNTREQWLTAMRTAQPGTTILVAPGTYAGGLSQSHLRGAADRLIVIAGEDPRRPPIVEGGGSGLHLSSPAHVVLRDLIFRGAEGNGLNIDDGGDKAQPARNVTLLQVTVTDVGPRGNRDGIKLSGLAGFRVENCRVERWGESGSAIDLVGCREGTITGCTFRSARGDAANGVQCKGGSREITISRCRFEQAGGRAVNIGGSTGLAYFRPEPQGFEAKDITVEDCLFVGSLAPIAFVGVDGAAVRHNILYRPRRWVVRILQETQLPEFVPCRNGSFTDNIVVFRSDEVGTVVNIGGMTAPETFTFARNLWHCLDRPQATRNLVRLPVAESEGRYGVDPRFRDAEQGDFEMLNPDVRPLGPRP